MENYTLEKVISYYVTFFDKDFERYFNPKKNQDGILVCSKRFRYSGEPTKRHENFGAAAAIAALLKKENEIDGVGKNVKKNSDDVQLPNGTMEDDLLFSALVAILFIQQSAFSSCLYEDLESFLKETNIPYFQMTPLKNIGDSWSLGVLDQVQLLPYLKGHKILFKEAIAIAYPWMKKRFMETIQSWQNGKLLDKGNYACSKAERISKSMDDNLFDINRYMTDQFPLTGQVVDRNFINDYFENMFFSDMKRYFKVENKTGYDLILFLGYKKNKRLLDGNPAGSMNGNMVFSAIILSLIFFEKSVWHAGGDEIGKLYHLSSGWPLISSGPGGGFEIPSWEMLEEAGLAPTADESMLFLHTTKNVFFVLNEIFRQILNKKGEHIRNTKANTMLYNKIVGHGHLKQRIVEELEKEVHLFEGEIFTRIQKRLEQYNKTEAIIV